jgi:hypothetical protein
MEEVEPSEDTCEEMCDEKLLARGDARRVSDRGLGGVKGLLRISKTNDFFIWGRPHTR